MLYLHVGLPLRSCSIGASYTYDLLAPIEGRDAQTCYIYRRDRSLSRRLWSEGPPEPDESKGEVSGFIYRGPGGESPRHTARVWPHAPLTRGPWEGLSCCPGRIKASVLAVMACRVTQPQSPAPISQLEAPPSSSRMGKEASHRLGVWAAWMTAAVSLLLCVGRPERRSWEEGAQF